MEVLEAAHDYTVTVPVQGRVIPLNEVKDATFAGGTLDPGAAVIPSAGPVVLPGRR